MLYIKLSVANKDKNGIMKNYEEINLKVEEEFSKEIKRLEEKNSIYIVKCEIIDWKNDGFGRKMSHKLTKIIKNNEIVLQDIVDLYKSIKELNIGLQNKLLAILEVKDEVINSIRDIITYVQKLEKYKLLPDVNDLIDMGVYLFDETNIFEEKCELEKYIDYELLACDYTKKGYVYAGDFTKYGYLIEEEETQNKKEEKSKKHINENEKVAVKLGYNFEVFPKNEIPSTLRRTNIKVLLEDELYDLYKGTSLEDERKIDKMFGSRKGHKLKNYIIEEEEFGGYM